MIKIILIGTMLFMLATLVFTTGSNSVIENGIYYLGITLPKERRREEAVVKIVAEYRKNWRKINLVGLAAIIPAILISDFVSAFLVYMILWFFVLIYVNGANLEKSGWKLYNWKISQDWYVKKESVRRVDTAVSSKKHTMPVSAYWSIAPLALASYCGYRIFTDGTSIVGIAFCLCTIMFIVIYFCIVHAPNKVYCDNSDTNLKINKSTKFEWSRCMMVHAYGAALMAFISISGIDRNIQANAYPVYIVTMAVIVWIIPIFVLLMSYNNTRKAKQIVAMKDIYDDDDIYYLTGERNPNQGMMQEKRVGIGFSLNMGKKADAVVVAIVMLFVCGLALFLLKYDLADITLDIVSGENVRTYAAVEAAGDKITFYIDEVESIELLEHYPSMSKNYGYDGTVYYIGEFNVGGYGSCNACVCLKTAPAVVVKTHDKVYIFNDESEEGTQQMYELIQKYR